MSANSLWHRFRAWLDLAPGHGLPRPDLLPIMTLLPHVLTQEAAVQIAGDAVLLARAEGGPLDEDVIRRATLALTSVPADDQDVAQVREILERGGYHVGDRVAP